jgi:hypothetical protein
VTQKYITVQISENRFVSSVAVSEEPETAVNYRPPVERSVHISNARDCTYIPPVRLNHPRIVDTESRYYQAHPPQLSPPQLREVTHRS